MGQSEVIKKSTDAFPVGFKGERGTPLMSGIDSEEAHRVKAEDTTSIALTRESMVLFSYISSLKGLHRQECLWYGLRRRAADTAVIKSGPESRFRGEEVAAVD